jgi:hypothetical protein
MGTAWTVETIASIDACKNNDLCAARAERVEARQALDGSGSPFDRLRVSGAWDFAFAGFNWRNGRIDGFGMEAILAREGLRSS